MESKMFDYICETPAALTGIISRRKEITKDFVSRFKDVGIEQIYVIGSGTSYHAGLAAKLYLEELLGIKVFNMWLSITNFCHHAFFTLFFSSTPRLP